MRDESEIRGHRRTYIGAMPGTIIRAMRDAGSNNPVLMIDEIDKMGADFRGDPSSAMLEVLDPEQNSTFRDHYLDLPFDLSKVLFITTANQLDPIPAPAARPDGDDRALGLHRGGEARDRQALPGAAPDRSRTGSAKSKIEFTDAALREIIEGYTREAGVRNLEREIGAVCAQGRPRVRRGHAQARSGRWGPRPWPSCSAAGASSPTSARRTGEAGVATGLAWTPVGGDVLFVEATSFPGEGKLQITGQLGDVMKESAPAALSYVKRNVRRWASDVPEDWFRDNDVHVHVPAGAIPKDGPSAGITMATALASLVSGRPVRSDTAMTGEITLTGQVLPIGGLKEKSLAAQRAEISRVIAPGRNQSDAAEFPPNLLKSMEFLFVETVEDVLAAALEPESDLGSRRRRSGVRRPSRDRVAASTRPRAAKT